MILGKKNAKQPVNNIPLQLSECYAKTISDATGASHPGVDVETHCRIVGIVASKLADWFPSSMKERFFPSGFELLVACHDIGKINPIFQEKIRRSLADYTQNSEPALKDARPEREQQIDYHWGVSKVALRSIKPYVADIAGVHHGVSSSTPLLEADLILGGNLWQEVRLELIEKLKGYFSSDFPDIADDTIAAFLAGFTTVCDWIGSGTVFSDLTSVKQIDLVEYASMAVEQAGFVFPHIRKGLSFRDIFPGYKPYEIQRSFYEQVTEPGLYIMEALMGQGKTEAALQAAYQLISTNQATGIYFALPTQLTSEKIYERFNIFLDTILKEDDRHRAFLVHGKAWMNQTDMGGDASPGYSWFNARKRKILAAFAVGTIDQALMSVIHVKHGFVRTFGLAGKVVIIDEVHTYDAYTGTLIDHLIRSLRNLGSTVILLSATLTKDRKKSLIKSVDGSCGSPTDESYPLITALTPDTLEELPSAQDLPETRIEIIHESEERRALDLAMDKAFSGELVLWIENTVPDAQNTFRKLAAWGKDNRIEVGLIHSRFDSITRRRLEDHWTHIFGKSGINERSCGGKILVGTQVLEQSLDIDADFLITRIAPSDMILQRIGRLWRHQNLIDRRPDGASPAVLILSPQVVDIQSNPKKAFGPTGMVYAPYILIRSCMVWDSLDSMTIPSDLRAVIEDTYRSQQDPDYMVSLKAQMVKDKEVLERYAFNSMSKLGKTSSDETAATRHSEVQTCDLLLVRAEPGHKGKSLSLIDGSILSLPSDASRQNRKTIAKYIAERTISIPQYMAPQPLKKSELQFLQPYIYISDDDNERLRVAILTESDQIVGLGGRTVNDTYTLRYTHVLGYRAEKR